VYEIIYLVDPTAIAIGREVEERGVGDFWVFTYFSYVTLTTLGYGDVLPTGLFARSMATLEAILGPLYLAILIARLVSLVDADSSARKTRADAEARGKGS
jgi:voltage-gated potassium channel Kch